MTRPLVGATAPPAELSMFTAAALACCAECVATGSGVPCRVSSRISASRSSASRAAFSAATASKVPCAAASCACAAASASSATRASSSRSLTAARAARSARASRTSTASICSSTWVRSRPRCSRVAACWSTSVGLSASSRSATSPNLSSAPM
ncbi:hypothetical protein [Blastococcus brunescens]|uniref:Uncharacterized protein n=1 Tax=Blastococcus brunescens TaxID=1564165 RepID=A0ABZ1B4P5_9ACTN|nr:hypothetical protein [Blastococcus sp. BMG 8361]WRL65772.1 hypothetical protein U6N30_09455 [Blastococcus sp. BMG 8361]